MMLIPQSKYRTTKNKATTEQTKTKYRTTKKKTSTFIKKCISSSIIIFFFFLSTHIVILVFHESHFSANVTDLIAVSNYMKEHFQAPSLLVGHSLGGAAAIFAGSEIDSIEAVATIGAPSNPAHVQKQLGNKIDTIRSKGAAEVTLAGRPFTFKKQFPPQE